MAMGPSNLRFGDFPAAVHRWAPAAKLATPSFLPTRLAHSSHEGRCGNHSEVGRQRFGVRVLSSASCSQKWPIYSLEDKAAHARWHLTRYSLPYRGRRHIWMRQATPFDLPAAANAAAQVSTDCDGPGISS